MTLRDMDVIDTLGRQPWQSVAELQESIGQIRLDRSRQSVDLPDRFWIWFSRVGGEKLLQPSQDAIEWVLRKHLEQKWVKERTRSSGNIIPFSGGEKEYHLDKAYSRWVARVYRYSHRGSDDFPA